MKLSTAIILFFIVFMVVQNQKECHYGFASRATPAAHPGNPYVNVGSLRGDATSIDNAHGRIHSTFQFTSPESWGPGMFHTNDAMKLNVGSRPHISGIPSVPNTGNPPYQEIPQPFNV
jgi:hypothetical protein